MTKLQKLLAELNSSIQAREAAALALESATDGDSVEERETALDTALTSETEARSAYQAEVKVVEQREAALAVARSAVLPSAPVSTPTKVSVTKEERTYRSGGEHDFIGDILAMRDGDSRAIERLTAHNAQMRDHGVAVGAAGASFVVPPLRLAGDLVKFRRFPRAFLDAVEVRHLPPNVDSVELQRILAGFVSAPQVENQPFTTGQITDDLAKASVKTYGHYYDYSNRLARRSDPLAGPILLEDAVSAIDDNLGSEIFYGPGTGDRILGIANVAGRLTATYTDATPTVPELIQVLTFAEGAHSDINRHAAEMFVMTARAWAWFKAGRDTQGRSIINVGNGESAFGQSGNTAGPTQPSGWVGDIGGVPVLVDGHIARNLGAGSNQTEIFLVTASDILYWESPDYVDNAPQAVAHMGKTRVVVSRDVLSLPSRRPTAITQVSGTGLILP